MLANKHCVYKLPDTFILLVTLEMVLKNRPPEEKTINIFVAFYFH